MVFTFLSYLIDKQERFVSIANCEIRISKTLVRLCQIYTMHYAVWLLWGLLLQSDELAGELCAILVKSVQLVYVESNHCLYLHVDSDQQKLCVRCKARADFLVAKLAWPTRLGSPLNARVHPTP